MQNDLSIQLVTRLLRHRLSTKASIDVRILEPDTSNDTVDFNEYYGTFLGLFTVRPNGSPVFLLFIRHSIGENIHLVIVYYMGNRIKQIQPSEKRLISARLGNTVPVSIINVVSTAPDFCDWSILLQTVEYSIDPSLAQIGCTRQVIEALSGSRLLSYNPHLPYPNNCHENSTGFSHLWELLKSSGIRCVDFSVHDEDIHPDMFDILRIKHEDHYLFAVYYVKFNSMMLILPHTCQFARRQDYESIVQAITSSFFSSRLDYVGSTRFQACTESCKDASLLKACILCLFLPLTTVKDCDIKSLVSDQDLNSALDNLVESRPSSRRQAIPQTVPEALEGCYDSMDDNELITTRVMLSGSEGFPEVLSITSSASSSAQSSQATIVYSQTEIEETIMQLGFASFMKRRLSRSHPPTDKEIDPMNDEHGCFLHNRGVFYEQLDVCLEYWTVSTTYSLYLPFEVDEDIDYDPDLSGPERFKVIPLFQQSGTCIAILDSEQEEWTVLDPKNSLKQSDEQLYDFEALAIKRFSFLRDWIIIPMSISSYFHKDYR